MRKEIRDFILAVNLLTDSVEFMIEENEIDEEKLYRRLEVVEKFKKLLEDK